MPALALSKLVFDDKLYPRQNVDEVHVHDLMRAMEGGSTLPPIRVAQGPNKIIDGVHRWHAHARAGAKTISAELKKYKNDLEMFRDAVLLNSATGLKLGAHDRLKVIATAEGLGLRTIDIALLLRTSEAYIRALAPMYARVTTGKIEKFGLKNPHRHFAGLSITEDQRIAMERGPGTSYLLVVRQLLDAIEFELLPSREKHPTLWTELEKLKSKLDSIV